MKRSKRILSAILVVLLLASTLNGFVFAEGADTITVTTPDDFRSAISNGNIKTVLLGNDIVLNADVTYEYDGTNKKVIVKKANEQVAEINAATLEVTGSFDGISKWSTMQVSGKTIDGQGHKIIGLYTDGAMFSSIDKASVIKNLTIENALVTSTTQGNVAVLSQTLNGDVTDVNVKGAVIAAKCTTADYPHVGGVIAVTNTTAEAVAPRKEIKCPLVKNVTFSGDVVFSAEGKNPSVGGIVGQLHGGKILNCINFGNVTVLAGKIYGLGGVVGLVESIEGGPTGVDNKLEGNNYVLNSENIGDVTSYTGIASINIGGVVGRNSPYWGANSKFQYINLYNRGNVRYYDGSALVATGNGVVGNVGSVATSYQSAFKTNKQGQAKYLLCDPNAQAATKYPTFPDYFEKQTCTSVYYGRAEYLLNCNAGNIDGACAWKRENDNVILDLGTPAKAPTNPDVTLTGEIDAAEFDYVKYYNSNDASLTDVLEGMFNEHKDESGGTTSFSDSTNTWRYDKGSHLHKMSGTNYNTAFTSVGSNGTSFEVTFIGTGIEWHTKYRNVMSSVDVYVDGKLVETLSAKSLSTANKNIHDTSDFLVYGVYGLEYGVHTLRGVDTSSGMMVVDFFKLVGTGAAGVQTEAREFDGYKYVDEEHHIHLFKGSATEGFEKEHTTETFRNDTFCPCQIVDAADYDYIKYFDKDGKPVASANLERVKADGLAHKTAGNYPASGDANSTKDAIEYANHYVYYGNSRYYKTNAFLTSDTDTFFTIVFEGTGIEWHTNFRAPGNMMADVEVYIDGELKGSKTGLEINESLSTGTNKYLTDNYTLFNITGLNNDRHIFVAKSTKKGTIIADYFKIIGGNAVKSTVAPEAVENPLVYNATEQTGVEEGVNTCVGEDVHYTLSGETEKTDAGEYTATATLKDGYVWSDGTTDAKQIPWSIAKAPVTVKANDKEAEYGADLPDFDATVEGLIDGDELEYQVTCEEADSNTIGTFEIIAEGDEEQGNYLVTYVPGTLTVGHTHTKGNDIMHNGAAHWYACPDCPILGEEVGDYEAAFEADPALKDTLGYEEHNFEFGRCETCEFSALPDYWDELKVKGITYNDDKTISVAFNTPDENVDMSKAAKLIVYASKDDVAHLPELFVPQNILVEGEDYELTYKDNNAVVTFAYDYKFVSIGIKNSDIALNPLEFFMLDDGVSEEEGDEDDDEELKLKKWIACNTDGAPKSDFDFVFFTTREEVQIATDSKLLTTDTYDAYSYGESDYQISLFNNAMLIDSQLLTSKYLRVAALANNDYEVKLQLVAQDVGGLLGYQESLSNSNYHRILAPITKDETDAIINNVTVRGWYGENFEYELDYAIDCVYTAYYDHSTLVDVATTLNVNGESAFAVIVIDGEGETHTGFDGPIYVRIYSDATDEYGDPILLRDGVLILG